MPRQKGSKNKGYGNSKQGYISLVGSGGNFRAIVSTKLVGEIKYISLGIKEEKSNIPDTIGLINSIEKEILKDLKTGILDRTFEKYKVSKILDKSSVKPVQYYLNDFESRYFGGKRKRNSQSEATFVITLNHLKLIFRSMEQLDLNLNLIDKVIKITDFGTHARQQRVSVISVMCNHFPELEQIVKLNNFKFADYAGGYEPEIRIIPSDEKIINGFSKIGIEGRKDGKGGESWAWVYGVLATYGLRPHELLAIDFDKSFNPPHYEIYLDGKLCDGIKTGNRLALPIAEEWVKEFKLAEVNLSQERKKVLTKVLLGMNVRGRNKKIALSISNKFKNKQIGFQPYDLRHAYAIRGYYRGFTINQMSKYMGHSVTMHEKKYQKYLPDDQKLLDYENTNENYKHQQMLREGKLSYDDLQKELHQTAFKLQSVEDDFTKSQERVKELEIEVAQLKAVKQVFESLQGNNNSNL